MNGTRLGSPRPDEHSGASLDDELDDRIAEILDELLAERSAARRRPLSAQVLGTISLILAVTASGVILGRSPDSWAIWPVAALTCIAAAGLAIMSRA